MTLERSAGPSDAGHALVCGGKGQGTALPDARCGPPSAVPVGTLLLVLLLGLGVCGLVLLPARTRASGRRLARVGFLGALGLVVMFVLIRVLTLPFD